MPYATAEKRAAYFDRKKDHIRAWRRGAPYRNLIQNAKTRAHASGTPFDLNTEWALSRWTGKCELTGIAFMVGLASVGPFSPSIDRIKPELGYVKDNCRFILMGVNAMKGAGTDEQMLQIASALCQHSA